MRPRPLALVLHQPAHWDRLEAALDLELHIPCEIETRRSTGPLLTAPVNRCSAHSASVKPSWISSASTSFPLRGSALGSGASQMAFRADRQRAGCASMCCLKARQTRRSTTRSCGNASRPQSKKSNVACFGSMSAGDTRKCTGGGSLPNAFSPGYRPRCAASSRNGCSDGGGRPRVEVCGFRSSRRSRRRLIVSGFVSASNLNSSGALGAARSSLGVRSTPPLPRAGPCG